jgi:hypothetical protein
MRLINAEDYPCSKCETKYCFKNCNRFSKWLYTEVVVRCKDCIHAVDITNYRMAKRFGDHAKQCMRCRGDSGFGYPDLSVVYPDGFCDEGEKRND